MVLISRDRLVLKAIRKRMDEKSLSGEKLLLFKSYNKSHFSYIRVAIERNILKNLFFFQKIVACLRDRIALLYDQPILPLLTRPSFALRNVLLKHDTHCSSFSYSWSKKHCHVSFHFVSLFSVLLNLRRWIRYAFFFFFMIDTIECIVNTSVILKYIISSQTTI